MDKQRQLKSFKNRQLIHQQQKQPLLALPPPNNQIIKLRPPSKSQIKQLNYRNKQVQCEICGQMFRHDRVKRHAKNMHKSKLIDTESVKKNKNKKKMAKASPSPFSSVGEEN